MVDEPRAKSCLSWIDRTMADVPECERRKGGKGETKGDILALIAKVDVYEPADFSFYIGRS